MDWRAPDRLRRHVVLATFVIVIALVLGSVFQKGTPSDALNALAAICAVGLTGWIVLRTQASRRIRALILCALFLIVVAQCLDFSENVSAFREIPILGAESSWNGVLNSACLSAGFILLLNTLLLALIDSMEGQQANARYRLLAENVSDVISTADLALKTTYVSPSVARVRGFSVEEVLQQGPEEYLAPESRAKALELFQTELERVRQGLRSADETSTVELEFLRKDGSTIWLETGVSPLTGSDGQPVGVLAVSRDISERRCAQESLRQSEARFRALVENAPVCILELDLSGHVCSINPSGLALLGLNLADSPPPGNCLESIAPGDRGRVSDAFARARMGESLYFSFELVRGDENRHVTIHLVPLRDDSGRVTRVMGIANDITDRVRAEHERAHLEAELGQAQKMESVGRLAGGVAHDFNNMLGVILGHTELALGALDNREATQAHLVEIERYCSRAADLTRQLLGFARQQTVTPRALVLNEAVAETLRMLRRLIGEDVCLTWEPGAGLWPVLIDPSQLDQILANLAVNARDAISQSGHIEIRTRNAVLEGDRALEYPGFVPGDYVEISVRDTGSGMSPETRDRIFEPFYTTKERGKGTGLGLATVYGIVKQNRGFITVESEVGQGTTFTIHFPRHYGSPAPHAEIKRTASMARGLETILLVEDEVALLGATRAMLEHLGYTVLGASLPREAIGVFDARQGEIGLVVTDVIMPDMNGRQLADALKAREPALPVLYISGYTSALFGECGILNDGEDFLQKPFSMKQLAERVRGALDRHGRGA